MTDYESKYNNFSTHLMYIEASGNNSSLEAETDWVLSNRTKFGLQPSLEAS